MSKLQKILLASFIVLLLITIGEIIYYFFYLSPKTQLNQNTNTNNNNSQEFVAIAADPIVLQNLEAYLETYKVMLTSEVVTASTINTVYEGTIKEIDTDGGTNDSGATYKVKITLASSPDNDATVYYNENNLSGMQIVQMNGEKEEKITINDLKIDDSIKIDEKLILNKDFSKTTMSFKITKL